jgi:hypothetical protein
MRHTHRKEGKNYVRIAYANTRGPGFFLRLALGPVSAPADRLRMEEREARVWGIRIGYGGKGKLTYGAYASGDYALMGNNSLAH